MFYILIFDLYYDSLKTECFIKTDAINLIICPSLIVLPYKSSRTLLRTKNILLAKVVPE